MSNTYVNKEDGFVDLSGMTKEMSEHGPKNKKRKRSKKYSDIGTEKKRLEYLYFRDDIMARTIVAK